MRTIIIGYGMAGSRLAGELARRGHDVTVFGAEPHAAYNRILLSGLLAGTAAESTIMLPEPPDTVDIRLGVEVTSIDRAARTVNGVPYDALILATGAEPITPPIEGISGVPVFRTLDDCRRIVKDAEGVQSAVVVGGGLLGVEAARGLAERGLAVSIVHGAPHLMERQLDGPGGEVLAATLARLGITVHFGQTAARTPWGLLLSDGLAVPADLVVMACGVKPSTTLAKRAGLAVGRGVLVDDTLRTSDPAIFAIGDCAEHRGVTAGLLGPAWAQADVIAGLLSGLPASYQGSRPVTRLKAGQIDLAAMGVAEGDEVLTFTDPARGTYARIVIERDRLAGAILIGDNPSAGQVIQLYDRGAPVPSDRRSLLLGRASGAVTAESPVLMPDSAVVCRCNGVTKGEIVRCGARDVAGIAAATRATTGCGSCVDAVAGLARSVT